MLSFFFQTTARYVDEYEDFIPEEEAEAINRVLPYDMISVYYNPLTSDDIKGHFKTDATAEDLKEYIIVWGKQFVQHPLCYISAILNQNHPLFMPEFDNYVYRYNQDCNNGSSVALGFSAEDGQPFDEWIGFTIPEPLRGSAITIVSYYEMLHNLPIFGLLSSVGFYCILLYVLTFFILKELPKKSWFVLWPVWIVYFFIYLSPMIIRQPRYAWPIIYAMPLLISWYMQQKKKNA